MEVVLVWNGGSLWEYLGRNEREFMVIYRVVIEMWAPGYKHLSAPHS